MTLSLAAVNNLTAQPVPNRLSHDIRSALATVALHLETLERLSGPSGAKAASAAHALISKAAGICTELLQEAANPGAPARRAGFDIIAVVRHVIELLQPIAPENFVMEVKATTPVMTLGNAGEVFRILFNLTHNAVIVARRTQRLTRIQFSVERAAATVVVRVSDDGPGLPQDVRRRLFKAPRNDMPTGFGLTIARELAERNGGTLEYDGEKGATFTLVLLALATVAMKESPVTRLLGRASVRV
jgi:signal transduction histidine kinase